MRYILINPVVEQMYSKDELNEFLHINGYIKVGCKTDWSEIVRQKYRDALKNCNNTIVDMRCPMACQSVKDMPDIDGLMFPDIEPILIHCAREISEREDLKGTEKVITTPCRSLADMGNSLNLMETTFYSWLDFLQNIKQEFDTEPLKMTPIPLGYFKELNVKQESLSGESEIHQYFESQLWKDVQLVELLYCTQGCHNGDGVIKDEKH